MKQLSKENIKEIAEQLDCGEKAYVNKKTGEVIFIPDEIDLATGETNPWEEEIKMVEKNKSDFHEIETPESRDSFGIMEDFANQVSDKRLQQKLFNALNNKKPFGHFKMLIDNSGKYREEWFSFKNARLKKWVKEELDAARIEYEK